jgi:hydroxyacylglutathione hydrolase
MANAALVVEQIPALSDNYIYLVHEPTQGAAAVIDPAEAAPVLRALKERGWRLDRILNTHHHHDHTGGNLEVKEATGCRIVGPRGDADRIPGLDEAVGEGDTVRLGAQVAAVLDTPGHTKGHISYWFREAGALFCADALFALGCGRMFEGEPGEMWRGLAKLRDLPGETRVYCAHEYTASNARFALSVEPGNRALQERARQVEAARAAGRPTVPSTIADELATNPFLRPESPEIRENLGLRDADPVAIFAELRRRKDRF